MDLSRFLPKRVKSFWNKENDNANKEVNISRNKLDDISTSTMDFSEDFKRIDNVIKYFESPDTREELNNDQEVLFLKLEFDDVFYGISEPELSELSTKCKNKSIVILFASTNRKTFVLYFKSKQIEQFLKVNVLSFMHDLTFFMFMATFVENCLRRQHWALPNGAVLESAIREIGFQNLVDERGYNLLLLAAEEGNSYVVNILIRTSIETESNQTNPQTLAYEGGHYDVLELLLQRNFTLPCDIDILNCTHEIKRIYQVGEDLRTAILLDDFEMIREIKSQNLKLRHFYDFSNESASTFALKKKHFKTYSLLLDIDIMHGPMEDITEIKKQLSKRDIKALTEIQYNNSNSLLDSHMHFLLSNSKTFGMSTNFAEEKYNIIRNIFQALNENPLIQIILKIVAATRQISIIFDFNNDSVELIDPSTNGDTKGIFYTTGRIYIAARGLLEGRSFEVLGTLAHELCHHAMNTVYENLARPYFPGDSETEKKFEEIAKNCDENKAVEPIISHVYTYSSFLHHAELIVRVPHLIALYLENAEGFAQIRMNFCSLFDFYEHRIVGEMKAALPLIEKRAEKRGKRSKKFIIFLCAFFIIIGVSAGTLIAKSVFKKPVYKFENLSESDKSLVRNASIAYKDESIQFGDLFLPDSEAYSSLISEDISQMLKGIPLNFSSLHLHYLDIQVRHSWKNMTRKLKEKFLESRLTFQNVEIEFQVLHKFSPKAFESLTNDQILEVLSGNEFFVHKMIENNTDVCVEREFRDEDIRPIYYDFMMHLEGGRFYSCFVSNNTKVMKTFEDYYEEFKKQDFNTYIQKIEEHKNFEMYKFCDFRDLQIMDPKSTKIITNSLSSQKLYQPMEYNHVVEEVEKNKIFLLSAEAGAGKTFILEQYAMRMKKEFSWKWVTYIDLKQHTQFYNASGHVEDIWRLLNRVIDINTKNEFEHAIFRELFDSGNVILFWNGFDEISPEFSEYISNVLEMIRRMNKNVIQFVSMRPSYAVYLKKKIQSRSFTLIPFDGNKTEEFLEKVFVSQKIVREKIPMYIDKVNNIVISLETQEGFDTPLLLRMISEVISNDVDIYNSENTYEIYQKFTEKKIDIWEKTSEFAIKFLKSLLARNSGFNMRQLYQKYALAGEIRFFGSSFGDLKVVNRKIPNELTEYEVSRMGILYINGPSHYQFAHKSFSDFFVAQYLIESVYLEDDLDSDKEAELRISLLKAIVRYNYYSGAQKIYNLINYFLQTNITNISKSFHPKIHNILKREFRENIFEWFNPFATPTFDFIFKFIKKDYELLKELMHVDGNETLYTATYNYYYYTRYLSLLRYSNLKDLSRLYLTDQDFEQFINGKHQKGVILFSLHCFYKYAEKNITHEKYSLDDELLKNDDDFYVFESIVKNLDKLELNELLMRKTSPIYDRRVQFYSSTKFWNFIDAKISKDDQKMIIKEIINAPNLSADYGGALWNRTLHLDELLSSTEIFDIFSKKFILHELIVDSFKYTFFEPLWNFLTNHTNTDQQRILLAGKRGNESQSLLEELLLHGNPGIFYFVIDAYSKIFTKSEIQQLFDLSEHFIIDLISIKNCDMQINYLKQIFSANEKDLRKRLERFHYILNKKENVESCLSKLYNKYLSLSQ